MSWQNIANSEIDANSPVSSTLMAKIKNNLDTLRTAIGTSTLFNNSDSDEPAQGVPLDHDNWTIVKQAQMVVPSGLTTFKLRVRAKIYGNAPVRKMRALLAGSYSDEYAFVGTEYELFTLTISAPASGLNSLQLQAYVDESMNDAYVHWFLAWIEGIS